MSLSGILNQVIAYGASTALGKATHVRPGIEAELAPYLKQAETRLTKLKATFTNLDPHKHSPALKKALLELVSASQDAIQDLRSDNTMDTIADVVGNHIGDFDSVDAFKEQLPKMASIKAMKQFAATLINDENYTRLETLFNELNTFAKLSKPKKMALLKSLDDKEMIDSIVAENAKLDIDKIKKDVKKKALDIGKELKLSKQESGQLITLFEDLTSAHLSTMNPLRVIVVEKLPTFFKKEHLRLEEQHPELVVHEQKPIKILTQFEQATSTTQKETGKRKATNDTEKALGKAAPKKSK